MRKASVIIIADCMGTIERRIGTNTLDLDSTPVPGLSRDEANNRSIRCSLLDGSITRS